MSMLAYATADGQVRVREVKFNPESPLEGIDVSRNVMDVPNQTLHPCTVLRWSPTSYEVTNNCSPNNHAAVLFVYFDAT